MAEYDAEVSDDPLYVLRHSTAHVLAQAVLDLYPGATFGIGPPVEDGFYYDFAFSKPLTEADLPGIESRMRRLAQEGRPFVQETLTRAEANAEFARRGQDYKLELIADKVEGDDVSVYHTGDFLDHEPTNAPRWPAELLVWSGPDRESVRSAVERGLREYDFVGDAEPWKREWTAHERSHHWLFAFRPTVRTRVLHLLKFRLLPRLRRERLYVLLRDLVLHRRRPAEERR